MVAKDEDALVCDFAEYYHIYNWRELPISYAATLAFGLSDNSRSKMALSGTKAPLNTVLLAAAVDRLSYLVWAKTKDAQSGKNAPKMITPLILSDEDDKTEAYDTAEDFFAAWERLTKGDD